MPKVKCLGLIGVCFAVGLCWYANRSAAQPQVPPEGPPPIDRVMMPNDSQPQITAPGSVDVLIDALAKVKAQQKELAKQEKALKEVLKKKLQEQKLKLQELDVEEAPAIPTPCCTTFH
jgi:hypothetical protein